MSLVVGRISTGAARTGTATTVGALMGAVVLSGSVGSEMSTGTEVGTLVVVISVVLVGPVVLAVGSTVGGVATVVLGAGTLSLHVPSVNVVALTTSLSAKNWNGPPTPTISQVSIMVPYVASTLVQSATIHSPAASSELLKATPGTTQESHNTSLYVILQNTGSVSSGKLVKSVMKHTLLFPYASPVYWTQFSMCNTAVSTSAAMSSLVGPAKISSIVKFPAPVCISDDSSTVKNPHTTVPLLSRDTKQELHSLVQEKLLENIN